MKYTLYKGKYYIVDKDSDGCILLTPVKGLDRVKAWARKTLKEATEDYALSDTRFIFNGNTVICLSGRCGMSGHDWGMATCRHGKIFADEYNREIGKAIAFCRMIGNSIPDFVFNENAED